MVLNMSAEGFNAILGDVRGIKRPWDAFLYGLPAKNAQEDEAKLKDEITSGAPENALYLLQTHQSNPRLQNLEQYLLDYYATRTFERWKDKLALASQIAGLTSLSSSGFRALGGQLKEMLALQIKDCLPRTQDDIDSICDTEIPLGLPIALAYSVVQGHERAIHALFDSDYSDLNLAGSNKKKAETIDWAMEISDWTRVFDRSDWFLFDQITSDEMTKARSYIRSYAAQQFKAAYKRENG